MGSYREALAVEAGGLRDLQCIRPHNCVYLAVVRLK